MTDFKHCGLHRLAKRWLLLSLAFVMAMPVQAATIEEKIFFVKDDGRHYVCYTTLRSDKNSYWLCFDKPQNEFEALADYLYIYPNKYTYDTKGSDFNRLQFAQGTWATMQEGDLVDDKKLTINQDGSYNFKNDKVDPNGHTGEWNIPDGFNDLVVAWLFPDKFDIVSHESSSPGEWVKRHNTLTYYGHNVNDAVFNIRYVPLETQAMRALRASLQGENGVSVESGEKGPKVTLAGTVLFASGREQLSDSGKKLLKKIAETLQKQSKINLVIEGHTDNHPITGDLARTYASNWELSSNRSLAVLHYLKDAGFSESRMEARAFGSQRPCASNDTEQGRARNRRIELLIVEPPEAKASTTQTEPHMQ